MINLAAVRATGSRPRVHGNGFIQLDLTATTRLHVWHPSVPKQRVSTPIHDHVFSFDSLCIAGRLVNVIYRFVEVEAEDPTAEFRLYTPQVREGCDTVLWPTDTCGYVGPLGVDMVMARSLGVCGNTYHMPRYQFHESIAPDGIAATIITKVGRTQAQGATRVPRVLVPRGLQPDNEFNRHHVCPEPRLWRIIEQTLKGRTR